MSIKVTSEIAPLKKVLLHRPGAELEHLTPEYLVRLLFDDIPFLEVTQKEHDAFADTLRNQGVQVLYLEDLMAEVLASDEKLREKFIYEFIENSGPVAKSYEKKLVPYLMGLSDNSILVQKTMAGIKDLAFKSKGDNPLTSLVQPKTNFVTDPIPNLYFTRDPFASIGNGVSLNHMYSVTRSRETIYGKYILKYHKDFAGKVPFHYTPKHPFSIEGGDIFNLSEKVVGIGLSQRTTPEACEILARNIFSNKDNQVENILAFDIPNLRAFMHLDTVFTQADTNKFVIHPGILPSLRVFNLSQGRDGILKAEQLEGNLESVLCKFLKLDEVNLIHCGGADSIVAEREQWNDGSNVLCVSPGTVIAYDRNTITNEILEENGINVLKIPSSELSRGRGGPRCMSMPLERL